MLADLLLHELEVYRRPGRTDRFGQPVGVNPTQLTGSPTATYPCRLTRGSRGLAMQDRAVDVFEADHKIFAEPDADVREDDAVRVVDATTGNVLLPAAKVKLRNLVYDALGPHHLEVSVIVQRGPA